MYKTNLSCPFTREGQKKSIGLRLGLTLSICTMGLPLFAGCGSSDRYFVGQAKVTSNQPNTLRAATNSWVAMSVKVAADGTVTAKYGPIGAVILGTGTFSNGVFSASFPSDGVGPITAQGKQVTEPDDKGGTITGITGTLTRNPGESGEFTVGESDKGKEVYEAYEVS